MDAFYSGQGVMVLDHLIEHRITNVDTTAQLRIDIFAYYQDISRQLSSAAYNPDLAEVMVLVVRKYGLKKIVYQGSVNRTPEE